MFHSFINAFALGAKMVNPRAEIYLDWRCLKDNDVMENLKKIAPSCFSTRDMLMPDEDLRYFGIYQVHDDTMRNLAMPLLHWGKFYEQLIHQTPALWKKKTNNRRFYP